MFVAHDLFGAKEGSNRDPDRRAEILSLENSGMTWLSWNFAMSSYVAVSTQVRVQSGIKPDLRSDAIDVDHCFE